MQIGLIVKSSNLSFGKEIIYKDRYIPNKQDQTHDIVRAHLEANLGTEFFYLDQLAKEKEILVSSNHKIQSYSPISSKDEIEPEVQVDSKYLKSLHLSGYSERVKNKLYSGENLAYQPSRLNALKKAGIKSVMCLVPYLDYKENCEAKGLNFLCMNDINESNLNVFDINGDLIKNLIRNPQSYAQCEKSGKVAALKTFIKTLNGENPDMPYPMYFGCQNGTDRTIIWYEFYEILKDEPMDKPLSSEVVEKLAKFSQEVDDYFRW